MSQTLGEKLRQAREERGMTISEIAEQTRISGLYIESIENDDYRILPGGIFNKGFVKSFAKTVGVDEQEALQDYAALVGNQSNQIVDGPKTYRAEVLTDDRNSSSNLPTIIIAVLILGLMTWGVLTLVRYIQQTPTQTAEMTNTNSNANTNLPANLILANANATTQSAASMNDLKIEVVALKSAVSLVSTADGTRANNLMTPEKPLFFEPKESLRLSYSKSKSQNVRLTINGKQITLPSAPENSKRNVIEFEINKDNLQQIRDNGQITFGGSSPR